MKKSFLLNNKIYKIILLFILLLFLFSKNQQLNHYIHIYYYNNLINSLTNRLNLNNSKNKTTFIYIEDKKYNIFKNKKPINISLSSDNSHIYPTLIVMVSILENNDKTNHIIVFYLLLSYDFYDSNIFIFESLKKKYDVIINYYYIPNIFKNLRRWRGSDAIYYKLLIPLLFPNIKRMIHLDGDTLVFKDLWEMFNLPFNNNYLLAQPTLKHIFKDKIIKRHVINVGVILFNIEKIRQENKDFEILYFLFKNGFTEQDAINYVILQQIGYLPFKYGIWFMGNTTTFKKWMDYSIYEKINETEVQMALNDPSIVHILRCGRKHWYKQKNKKLCKKYNKLFYSYAKKTDYYEKIYNKYIYKK